MRYLCCWFGAVVFVGALSCCGCGGGGIEEGVPKEIKPVDPMRDMPGYAETVGKQQAKKK